MCYMIISYKAELFLVQLLFMIIDVWNAYSNEPDNEVRNDINWDKHQVKFNLR